jgi:Zn-dependent protease with chaperone function
MDRQIKPRAARLLLILLSAFTVPCIQAMPQEEARTVVEHLAHYAPRVPAATLTIKEDSSAPRFPFVVYTDGCRLQVSSTFLKGMDGEAFTAAVAHELAHCALGHSHQLDLSVLPKNEQETWNREYDADLLGVAIARDAGLNILPGLTKLLSVTGASGTHPSGQQRIAAVSGEQRTFRELVRKPANMADGFHFKDGVLSLR